MTKGTWRQDTLCRRRGNAAVNRGRCSRQRKTEHAGEEEKEGNCVTVASRRMNACGKGRLNKGVKREGERYLGH